MFWHSQEHRWGKTEARCWARVPFEGWGFSDLSAPYQELPWEPGPVLWLDT